MRPGESSATIGRVAACAIALALALAPAPARADGDADRARAREAYDRGAAAHQRGDHATAARELALADALVPNPVTLQAALESALAADDAALGMELCDRSQRARTDAALAALVRDARARFGRRAGRLRVDCPAATACTASVDGAAIETGRAIFVPVGRHVVTVRTGEQEERRPIEVEPGGSASVVVTGAPAPPPPAPAPAREGPSIGWFAGTLGAAAVAGGVTIGLGVDTAKKHDAFVSAGCAGSVHGDCTALADAGRAAQLRTNVLVGVTGALAAATVVVGVVTFRARGADRAALTIGGAQLAALRVPLP
jgi:hypothetical protein